MRPTGARRAARKDENDKELARYAEGLGWFLIHQPPGNGCDWIAITPGGRVLVCEIKNPKQPPSRRLLTDQELVLFEACVERGVQYCLIQFTTDIDRLHRR